MDFRSLITLEPDTTGGRLCIRGHRFTVYDVLDYLSSGMTEAEIPADFPDLTAEDIWACLSFAADGGRRRCLAFIFERDSVSREPSSISPSLR